MNSYDPEQNEELAKFLGYEIYEGRYGEDILGFGLKRHGEIIHTPMSEDRLTRRLVREIQRKMHRIPR